jgi:hypothetical protein
MNRYLNVVVSLDVLQGMYSWAGLSEDGVSGHRNASERQLIRGLIYTVWCVKVWLVNGETEKLVCIHLVEWCC